MPTCTLMLVLFCAAMLVCWILPRPTPLSIYPIVFVSSWKRIMTPIKIQTHPYRRRLRLTPNGMTEICWVYSPGVPQKESRPLSSVKVQTLWRCQVKFYFWYLWRDIILGIRWRVIFSVCIFFRVWTASLAGTISTSASDFSAGNEERAIVISEWYNL